MSPDTLEPKEAVLLVLSSDKGSSWIIVPSPSLIAPEQFSFHVFYLQQNLNKWIQVNTKIWLHKLIAINNNFLKHFKIWAKFFYSLSWWNWQMKMMIKCKRFWYFSYKLQIVIHKVDLDNYPWLVLLRQTNKL